jgi:hypothetical protein
MGWASGTEVASGMVDLLKYVPVTNHKPFLVEAFRLLENMDWDTQGDLCYDMDDPYFELIQSAFKELHPNWD